MKIEDEIKQSKFYNDYHKAYINILFTAAWINSHNQKYFKKYNISAQQFNILRILKGQNGKPATLKLLTERMIDKMSNTSRLVDKLYAKKYVNRKVCVNNRRQAEITLTDKGFELINDITAQLENEYTNIKTISIQEAKQLSDLLDKLRG
jgi:DNA-binding MarR family transcriptional regulator